MAQYSFLTMAQLVEACVELKRLSSSHIATHTSTSTSLAEYVYEDDATLSRDVADLRQDVTQMLDDGNTFLWQDALYVRVDATITQPQQLQTCTNIGSSVVVDTSIPEILMWPAVCVRMNAAPNFDHGLKGLELILNKALGHGNWSCYQYDTCHVVFVEPSIQADLNVGAAWAQRDMAASVRRYTRIRVAQDNKMITSLEVEGVSDTILNHPYGRRAGQVAAVYYLQNGGSDELARNVAIMAQQSQWLQGVADVLKLAETSTAADILVHVAGM